MSLAAGKEVLSVCNKCNLTLAHTIVVMKDHKTPDKVRCNTCKGTHAYKDPAQKVVARKRVPNLGTPNHKTSKVNLEDMWSQAMKTSTGQELSYNIQTKFNKGDVINHPSFGVGIVEKTIDNDKIEILFRTSFKTLIHNKH
jgi:hypothetical protein